LNEGERKMCAFQRKTGYISKPVRDTARVTVNQEWEVAYALSNEIKIIDVG